MKRHVIKTDKAELLIVEMPRVYDFNLDKDKISICDFELKE